MRQRLFHANGIMLAPIVQLQLKPTTVHVSQNGPLRQPSLAGFWASPGPIAVYPTTARTEEGAELQEVGLAWGRLRQSFG